MGLRVLDRVTEIVETVLGALDRRAQKANVGSAVSGDLGPGAAPKDQETAAEVTAAESQVEATMSGNFVPGAVRDVQHTAAGEKTADP